MKNIISLSVIIAIIFIISGSCTKVEDIVDFPIKEPTMVLNCYFTPDSNWKIQVSRSLSVIDNADLSLIVDAKIDIYEDMQLLATITHAQPDGYYYYNLSSPKIGSTYKIEVTHPKYESISSEETVPKKVDFNILNVKVTDSLTYYDYWLKKSVGTLKASATLKITDDGNDLNYYRLTCFYWDSTDQSHIYKEMVYLESDDIMLVKNYYNGLLFNDKIINGKTYNLNFKFEDYRYFSGKTLIFVLESMNAAKYNYEFSLQKYWDSKENPFSEPVQVYNNIKNGYGIFAAYAASTKNIYFK